MKKLILSLLFLSTVAHATVTSNPNITGISSGAGLSADLSNLTSPTAANQSLLFGIDATFDIGATLASRPQHVFTTDYMAVGYYPLGVGHTFATILNSAAPGLYFYNGGTDQYNVVASGASGVSIQNFGAGIDLLNVQNHQFRFADTSAAANVYYFKGGATGVTVDNNLSYAGRKADNSADIPMLWVDAFNRTNIAALSGQNILLNNNIIPASADALSMGVVGDAFLNIQSNAITLGSSGASNGSVDLVTNDPAGNGTTSGLVVRSSGAGKKLYLFTDSGTASADTWVETGNASAGDSGSIHLATGTATGTRGNLFIDTGFVSLPTTVTAIGTTGSITLNKMSGTVNIASAAATATVTDSVVTANSIVLGEARTNDTTCAVKNIVPGSGSFVVNMTANCTAATSVGFVVFNQ